MACAATSPVRSSTLASTTTCDARRPASSAAPGGVAEDDAQQVGPIGQLALAGAEADALGRERRPALEARGDGREDGGARRRDELGVEIDAVGRARRAGTRRRPAAAAGGCRGAPSRSRAPSGSGEPTTSAPR